MLLARFWYNNKYPSKKVSKATQPKENIEEALICFCHGITEAEIREAIKNGALTLQDIKDRTKASTGCGGCTPECEKLLSEMLNAKK